ncbi:alpha/beta hydrolase [Streptomyces sp. NPDC018045]|uniref:alpha/beta hydrolase n=1 Tax=Streptomyces sp. NPDC018045 TaxID=3365037 RepID=UPI00378E2688
MSRHTSNRRPDKGGWRARSTRRPAAGATAALLAAATALVPLATAPPATATPVHPAALPATRPATPPPARPDSASVGRGALLTVTPLGTRDRAQLVAAARQAHFAGSAADWRHAVRHDVSAYRVGYRTITPDGRPTTASGLLVLPRGAPDRLPALVHTHGGMTARDRAPSVNAQGPDRLATALYAAGGRAAVAPDYLGLGKGPGRHPFLHTAATVSASLDMLRAARTAVPLLSAAHSAGTDHPEHASPPRRTSLDGRVYVTGYSQGGHAAMGFARALAAGADPRFRLRGLAPGGGPYDLLNAEIPAAFDGRVSGVAAVLTFSQALISHHHFLSPPLYSDPHEVFRPPYASFIDELFNGEHQQDEVIEKLPGTLRELLTDAWYEKLRRPSGRLLDVFRAIDTTCSWAPEVPVTLHTASGDHDVVKENTLSCARQLTARGAFVTVVDRGAAGHNEVFQQSVLDVTRSFPLTD